MSVLLDELRQAVRRSDKPLREIALRADLQIWTVESFLAGRELPFVAAWTPWGTGTA